MKEIIVNGVKCWLGETEIGYKVVVDDPALKPTILSRKCPTEKPALELAQL